jgi:hypothetical protein
MSAKDKAKKLVDDYRIVLMNEDTECGNEILCTVIAKQCALICIDEMLDFRNALYINEGSLAHQWLLDVRQEIEKL